MTRLIVEMPRSTWLRAVAEAITDHSVNIGHLAFARRASALRHNGWHVNQAINSGLGRSQVDRKGLVAQPLGQARR